MRIFIDTNIMMEFLCNRPHADEVERILSFAIENDYALFASSGSLYTLSYIVEKHLKALGYNGNQKIDILREQLTDILDIVQIANIDTKGYVAGVNNQSFKDIEDSFQYQNAIDNHCDVLVTLNINDFPISTSRISIVTPIEFLKNLGL